MSQDNEKANTDIIKTDMENTIKELSDTINCNNIVGAVMFCRGIHYAITKLAVNEHNSKYMFNAIQLLIHEIEDTVLQVMDEGDDIYNTSEDDDDVEECNEGD